MLNTPFSPWPSYTQQEIDAVQKVLLSNKVNYWTGTEGREFEKEFAKWCGTEYAVAVANGTVALDLAFIALGIGEGDEVIVTSRTFIASVSAIVNAKAIPVFADVCEHSQNITPTTIKTVITPRTKAIVCVHLAGWPCDMDGITTLAKEHNLKVIEDCAQAHGAKYKGRPVGSLGDIAAWSFCQDKIITTGGEGGMVTTNDYDLWAAVWSYKDHGKSWQAVYTPGYTTGFRWLHESFGTNWRLTEMQSAIGRIQLQYMPQWHERRSQIAAQLLETCQSFPALALPIVPKSIEHAWYRYYVFVKNEYLKDDWGRDRIIAELNSRSIPCYPGSCSEVYLEKAFDHTTYRPEKPLPVAKHLGETSMMFLTHPTLTDDEITQTCCALKAVMTEASS